MCDLFRRDQKRKDQFLAKKNLDAKDSSLINSESVGLTKVNLVEPKDEIELETPVANESLAETEVNYVGEYVYDTKLERDDIHKEFWKKWNGNFKDGVKEFSDGSTCNEKILISGENAHLRKDSTEVIFLIRKIGLKK